MKKLLGEMQFKAMRAFSEFKNSEKGDTNFISIIIIIAIVLVLAGAFFAIANGGMTTIGTKFNSFISNPG